LITNRSIAYMGGWVWEEKRRGGGVAGKDIIRGSAGIGRQAGLRIQCRKAWGFKSPLPHHKGD
jgi:hypothetical protein